MRIRLDGTYQWVNWQGRCEQRTDRNPSWNLARKLSSGTNDDDEWECLWDLKDRHVTGREVNTT